VKSETKVVRSDFSIFLGDTIFAFIYMYVYIYIYSIYIIIIDIGNSTGWFSTVEYSDTRCCNQKSTMKTNPHIMLGSC